MIFRSLALIALFFAGFAFSIQGNVQDTKLAALREDFALRYMQPDAHFALAKYHIEQGNLLQAFFILEYARRYRFETSDFDKAFIEYFGDPMPEPPNQAKDAFEAAGRLVTEQKYDEAEILFKKANAIYDKSFFINAWIGRFYHKTKADSSQALSFYFKAYFLYPHAYETEYVESRIRAISIDDAGRLFNLLLRQGKSVSELARHSNPIIVSRAIEVMAKDWKPEYMPLLYNVMANDDSTVRWGAFITILKHADQSRDRFVNDLLLDPDSRKRGLAAYAVIERPGIEKFGTLKKMLSDKAELIRFDAVSALLMRGGDHGKKIVIEHQSVEKQPRLRTLIEKTVRGEIK